LIRLGLDWGELGQQEPALAATCEAVDLYRMLAMQHTDVFQADLAMSLKRPGRGLVCARYENDGDGQIDC